MRVLILTSTYPRFANDVQANFVGEQATAWAAERPLDHLVVLAPGSFGVPQRDVANGFTVERFRYLLPERAQKLAYPAILPNLRRNPLLWGQVPPFVVAEYFAARRMAQRISADCVYAHWTIPQGLVAWQLKRSFGIPYFLQNHSSDLYVLDKLGALGRKLARTLLWNSAHFFCVNADQRRHALELFEGSERDEFERKCTTLPMGIAKWPMKIASDQSGFDIATIGRLSRKKGIDLLIRAAESLAKRGIRPSIGIAGDGEERERLKALVDRADVTFVGFLTGPEKDRFFATARCFAFPARAVDGDVEGLPVALLEALSRGTPVLASRDTNIELLPEWAAIRDDVVFVEDPSNIGPLERAIERLITRDRNSCTARHIKRYHWNNLIHEYLAPIDSALAQVRRSATSR